jgi:putative phosphoesterase
LGVISDTHGRLDPALHEVFAGVERIVHAGDVGGAGVLAELATIAPVTAVRGNTDVSFGVEELPEEAALVVAGHRLLVGHVRAVLLARHEPAREGFDVVVTGHSHRYAESREGGVLYLDPGAAGAARFGLPRSVAIVELGSGTPHVIRIELK